MNRSSISGVSVSGPSSRSRASRARQLGQASKHKLERLDDEPNQNRGQQPGPLASALDRLGVSHRAREIDVPSERHHRATFRHENVWWFQCTTTYRTWPSISGSTDTRSDSRMGAPHAAQVF